jgi:tRNA-2-methylthio-N6-dimethylallyladenosine synthase
MNVYDSRIIAELLTKQEYEEVQDPQKADVIIVNTCSVREHAETRAIGRINALNALRKKNPNLLIGVVGCMAQNLKNSIKGADFVVGPSNYRDIPEIIGNALTGLKTCFYTDELPELYSDILPSPDETDHRPTAFVPIMRGCNNFCAYCIVPYVRGRARSRPHKDIIDEINLLTKKDIKEVILLGQNVYNDGKLSFVQLLKQIDKSNNIRRLRFITSHPKDIDTSLFEAMRDCKSLCEHIHLPLQSGSTKILQRMNRKYTREHYLDIVSTLRETIPDASITTDIMVGLPGETDKDFEDTMDMVDRIRFDFAYMFKFSKRKGTRAYNMDGQVAEKVKKERLTKLIETQNKITRQKNASLIGKVEEVLVEGKSKKGNLLFGKTRSNKVVLFDGKLNPGAFVNVKIESLKGWTPYGHISNNL